MDLHLIREWRDRAIMVVGDVMLDRYVYGNVERISPEAPVPVLHQNSETLMLGGAANVARNVVALGGKSLLVSVLGQDAFGKLADHLMIEGNIEGHCARVPDYQTTVKTRFVSGGQQIMRLDSEDRLHLGDATLEVLQSICLGLIDSCSAIILSDYAKGVLSDKLVRYLIDLARAKSVPVLVDPKSRDLKRYSLATVIKPNAQEAAAIVGFKCDTDVAIRSAARYICDASGIESVVLTRGSHGMTVWQNKSMIEPLDIPAVASEVYDVSGAGDTVMATLALALAAGADLTAAARLANIAAGLVVAHRGTAVVTPMELTVAIHRQYGAESTKITELPDAINVAEAWREAGLVVGFTNGCFDLIHPGHIHLLKSARGHCDRLIVAINSDRSVTRLKGTGRPIQNEAGRATVLGALQCVDLVIIFDEDTPLVLIESIAPDRLIKGDDYSVEKVIGAPFVTARGGKVVLVSVIAGNSTTALIKRSQA